MWKPKEVSGVDLAFGGDMKKLLPSMAKIPQEFKNNHNKWVDVTEQWFFSGLKNAVFTPKEGIDQNKALRHIKAILGSWGPRHGHKIAGVAFLLSEFFEDIKYEK